MTIKERVRRALPAEPPAEPAAQPPEAEQPRRRQLFPGERRVWLIAALLGGIMVAGILVALLVPRDYYTGTNSLHTRGGVTGINPSNELCLRNLKVPAGTGRIQVDTFTDSARRPRVNAGITAGVERIRSSAPPGPGFRSKIAFPMPELASDESVRLCMTVDEGEIFFGGMAQVRGNDTLPTLNGSEIPVRVAAWYLPPAGEKRSVLAAMPDILERASLFRPGWVGPWTYVLILLLVMPAAAYAGVRLLATSDSPRRGMRLPVAIGLIAFVNAACWGLIAPSFNAPDESEHFAAAQYFAETGNAPGGSGSVYSTEQNLALEAVNLFASTESADGKPPWDEFWERNLEHRLGFFDGDPPADDGGGHTSATGVHSPLYYALQFPAYTATKGASTFAQLWAMRLFSALLGGIVAACAFLIVSELAPRRRVLAVAAGLLVGFQPMFGFISGSVNNDVGVNAAAAVLLYLIVRALTRGLSVRLAVAIGVVLVVMPLLKGTGYALYPAALVGILFAAARLPWRTALKRVALVVAPALALYLAWAALTPVFDRDVFTTPGGDPTGSDILAFEQPLGFLAYLWQVFLPKLPFMHEHWAAGWPAFHVYGIRGWGAFGWYAMTFADTVYQVIVGVMAITGVLAVVTLVRERARVRRILPQLLVLLLAIIGVVAAVHAFYYVPGGRGGLIAEMGRYTFPAITALATVVAGACLAFGRRWATPMATGFVVLVMGFALACQVMALSRFYLLV